MYVGKCQRAKVTDLLLGSGKSIVAIFVVLAKQVGEELITWGTQLDCVARLWAESWVCVCVGVGRTLDHVSSVADTVSDTVSV